MKKINLWLLFLITFSFFICGCGKKITTYEEIKFDEFMEMINNKETFPLFVGSHECSHCDDFKKTINNVIEDYQIKIYYIDIANMTNEEYNKFLTIVNFGGSTPTTVFITDGKEETVYNRIVGALSYSKVVEKLKKVGYIKVK